MAKILNGSGGARGEVSDVQRQLNALDEITPTNQLYIVEQNSLVNISGITVTGVQVPFDGVGINDGDDFSLDTVTNVGELTALRTGRYTLSGKLLLKPTTSTVDPFLLSPRIRVNGSPPSGAFAATLSTAGGLDTIAVGDSRAFPWTGVLEVEEGDTVQAQIIVIGATADVDFFAGGNLILRRER